MRNRRMRSRLMAWPPAHIIVVILPRNGQAANSLWIRRIRARSPSLATNGGLAQIRQITVATWILAPQLEPLPRIGNTVPTSRRYACFLAGAMREDITLELRRIGSMIDWIPAYGRNYELYR